MDPLSNELKNPHKKKILIAAKMVAFKMHLKVKIVNERSCHQGVIRKEIV
jgi:hypothetical protein